MSALAFLNLNPDIERRIIELINSNASFLSREDARTLVKSISISSNIVFQPRAMIFCLTLKLIVGSRLDLMARYCFGMIRGLYKDYLRSKNQGFNKKPRRSFERSKEQGFEGIAISGDGERRQKTSMYSRRTEVRSRTRTESPMCIRAFAERISNASKTLPILQKRLLISISKTFKNQLSRCFAKFRGQPIPDPSARSSKLQSFISLLTKKTLKSGLSSIFSYKTPENPIKARLKRIPLAKSVSMLSEDSRYKSQNFEERDKELWRRRHPLRKHSPTPSEASRPSMTLNSQFSDSNSPRNHFFENPFIKNESRRNTLEVLRKIETFGTVNSDEAKDEESQSTEKDSKDALKRKKKEMLRSGKNKDKIEESKKKWTDEKPLEKAKKLEKMIGNIDKSIRTSKTKALFCLAGAVNEEKMIQKKNAADLINDLLTFIAGKSRSNLQRCAFEAIKSHIPAEKGEEEIVVKHIPEEKKQIGMKPQKKAALRSGKPNSSNPEPEALSKQDTKALSKPNAEAFLQKLEFLNTHSLKNKLVSFIAIIEESDNLQDPYKPEVKNSLRNVFRILESKRFSKLCRTFASLRRRANQKHLVQQKRRGKIFIVLAKLIQKAVGRNKTFAFKSIMHSKSLSKAALKLSEVLKKVLGRVKASTRPLVLYSIRTYAKAKGHNSRISQLKLRRIFSRLYSKQIGKAFL